MDFRAGPRTPDAGKGDRMNTPSLEALVERDREHDCAGRIPLVIPPNRHNRFYLETKAARSGHWIDFAGKKHLLEQDDPVLVEGMPEEGPS